MSDAYQQEPDRVVRGRIHSYLIQLGLPRDVQADDVVQDVMIAILKGLDMQREGLFWPFAFKIARNRRNDEWRKWSRDPTRKGLVVQDNKPTDAPTGPDQDELKKLAECQKKLAAANPKHADAIALKFKYEQSDRQIAEALHISPATANSWVHRALTWLRDCMNSGYAHEGPAA